MIPMHFHFLFVYHEGLRMPAFVCTVKYSTVMHIGIGIGIGIDVDDTLLPPLTKLSGEVN
jgi:hypothetical protein